MLISWQAFVSDTVICQYAHICIAAKKGKSGQVYSRVTGYSGGQLHINASQYDVRVSKVIPLLDIEGKYMHSCALLDIRLPYTPVPYQAVKQHFEIAQ